MSDSLGRRSEEVDRGHQGRAYHAVSLKEQSAIQAARQMASSFEYSDTPEKAVDAYKEFGAILSQSKNEQIADQGEQMEGAARHLGLVGNPIEITGTLLDGKKFDWTKYRGKVVLVDFWATGAAPHRRAAERPQEL